VTGAFVGFFLEARFHLETVGDGWFPVNVTLEGSMGELRRSVVYWVQLLSEPIKKTDLEAIISGVLAFVTSGQALLQAVQAFAAGAIGVAVGVWVMFGYVKERKREQGIEHL